MKITNYAVKNYQFTLVIFIMIIALGITTLLNMPRSEDPEMHAPTFTVVVVYPGTSPGGYGRTGCETTGKRNLGS